MFLTRNNTEKYPEWLENATINGSFALIDKEKAWTSFDVVAKLRNLTRIKKVGHTGTLDPLATGLLIICFGKGTKKANEFLNMPKKYNAKIKLGATTKTDDAETDEENIKPVPDFTEEEISSVLKNFTGKIKQVPPMFSAKRVKGERLYKMARKNFTLVLEPIEVEVYAITGLDISLPFISFDVECSKGTYIRSLARDIGKQLGTGGYLAELRRISIGEYNISDALRVNEFVDLHKNFSKKK